MTGQVSEEQQRSQHAQDASLVARAAVFDRISSDPEFASRICCVSRLVHADFGRAVLAMISASRYRHLSMADIFAFVIEPMMHDQLAVVTFNRQAPDLKYDPAPVTGVIIPARVSQEVDTRILEQIASGVFPVRLKPDDWASGDNVWILDVIAPSEAAGRRLAQAFGEQSTVSKVSIHSSLDYLRDQPKPTAQEAK